ncbi:MAG: hypothetical protein EOO01_00085 [Chitinophagaceae bacterium]|nr:MAG: hypothetical protein EOO01_00085 [Chitinophagaceae bacterium]
MEMAALLGELESIGLWSYEWEDKLAAFLVNGTPVVVDVSAESPGAILALELSRSGDDGLGLEGYEIWLPRAIEYVNDLIPTQVVEQMLREIDFPAVLPDDFSSRAGQHPAFGKLSEVFEEMDNVELFFVEEFDLQEIRRGREILDGLLVKYGAGNGLEGYLMRLNDVHWKEKFYEVFPFPAGLHVGMVINKINEPGSLRALSDRALIGPIEKVIMEAKNLDNLKEEMVRLGFSENLIGQMEAKMAANEPRFILYDELESDKGRVELALHFNQSRSSEYYYFNKFDVVREVQPPLAPGEKYFVTSQRQGEDAIVKTFEMPSLAVKEFNARLEASKDIRGAAQIYAGADLGSSKELATMADGKIIDVDKEFYKTLKNPAPGQTIYLEKGNGFTLSQSLNLLSGRSVYREDMLNVQKNEYTAWAKLDFDTRDKGGNFHVKTFSEGYGYDLSAVLDRYDLVELKDVKAREVFEAALKNGDMAPATVELDGKKETILVVAVPEFKQVNMYSLEGKSIKRETVAKEEKLPEVGVEKGKGVEKTNKKGQEEGLSV